VFVPLGQIVHADPSSEPAMTDDIISTDAPDATFDAEQVRTRMEQRLRASEAQLVELESALSDMLRGHDTIQEDRDSTRLVVDSIREDVRLLRGALDRLDDGTYGKCMRCKSPIAPERLDAVPTATLCARCA
jgi:DnaK suppressor protein